MAAAAAIALAFVAHDQGAQADRLRATVTAQHKQLVKLGTQLSNPDSVVNGPSNQVGRLTSPSDPLSSYNDPCNQQMLNDNTGNDQTYYFPCTNSAVTTPQPGN